MSKTEKKPNFVSVYNEHRHHIYSYVYYRVNGNKAVAEDVTSDVFLKAYSNYDSYNDSYALSTWLYTITKRTLIDYYRKQKHTIELDEYEYADDTDSLYRLVTEDISESEVLAAIAKLPELQRVCLTKQYFQGQSAKTVAEEQGISHAAARKHVSRAIATLRSALLSLLLLF